MDGPELQGIDVSSHQGVVDFAAVARAGFRFAICKATEGVGFVDPRFGANWAQLVELGHETLYRGAYHFARPSSVGGGADGESEALSFCTTMKSVGHYGPGALPPVLDFEEYSDSDVRENVPWIEAFVRVVENELGRSPMIYTGANVWRFEVGDSPKFTHLPLWQVYYSRTASHPPATPWHQWTFWQWSGGGRYAYYGPVPGIPGSGICDVNRFNGTEQQLATLAEIGPMPASFPRPPANQDLVSLRGGFSNVTQRVQGLLLAQGFGPDGLVDGQGRPDGWSGPKTEGYLVAFKTQRGLAPNTIVDWATWWALTYADLPVA